MKVYVDELPPNCAYCSFWVDGRCIVDEGSAFCPLEVNKIKTQSLADYTKQVRKEVCENIKFHSVYCHINGEVYYKLYPTVLDEIEKGEVDEK